MINKDRQKLIDASQSGEIFIIEEIYPWDSLKVGDISITKDIVNIPGLVGLMLVFDTEEHARQYKKNVSIRKMEVAPYGNN